MRYRSFDMMSHLFIIFMNLAEQVGADPQLRLECLNFIVKNLQQIELGPLRVMAPNIAAQVISTTSCLLYRFYFFMMFLILVVFISGAPAVN